MKQPTEIELTGEGLTAFWRDNLLENVNFEDREGDGRIALKWLLGRWVVRIGDGLNCLGTIFGDGLVLAVLYFQVLLPLFLLVS
jgi:hypothetical protein